MYLVPCLLIFGVFLFYPFFKTIYLSLYKTNKLGEAKLFVGLGNYTDLLQSSSFWNSYDGNGYIRTYCGSWKYAAGLDCSIVM